MLFQDLQYFAKVAEAGSISRAADELYRTYQGVHKSISRLEEEIGQPLFVRSNNSMILTPLGEYLLNKIVKPLEAYWTEAAIAVESFENYNDRTLRVGVYIPDTDINAVAEDICERFQRLHPHVQIEKTYRTFPDNAKDLLNDSIDIGVCSSMDSDSSFESALIFPGATTAYSLLVSPEHPLAKLKSVTLRDIQGYTLLNYDFGHLTSFNRFLLSHPEIDQSSIVTMNPANPLTYKLLSDGVFVRISPNSNNSNEIKRTGCVQVPFDPPIHVPIGFMYKKRTVLKQLLYNFIEFLKEEMANCDK